MKIAPLRLAGIKDCLEEIADRNYQWLAWTGQLPNVWSDEAEVICSLCSDCAFDDDEYPNEAGLTEPQTQAVLAYRSVIDNYCKKWRSSRSAEDAIDDPDWDKVRVGAQKILPILYPDDAARYARGQWHAENTKT